MPDYHHDLLFGVSIPPHARDHEAVLATAELADSFGLDLVGIQDHPYQAGFLDMWTLLSYIAGRTKRLRLFPDVANIPLRPPAVLARSASALDILSGGRVELGLGAGYLLQPIAAMGAPRRKMVELVEALDEAITLIRALWSPGPPVRFEGKYYSLDGARPGPFSPHPIAIWVGAYKKRMLQLTGRAGDGWIPSLGYAWPEELAAMNQTIDAAAEEAGRSPAAIRRGFNLTGSFTERGSGFLQGPPHVWVEQLTKMAIEDGISAFNLGTSPGADGDLKRWAEEVAPAVREAVEEARRTGTASSTRQDEPAAVAAPEPEVDGESQQRSADEEENRAIGRAGQQTLLAIHEHLRQELARLMDVIEEVRKGRVTAAEARSYLNTMTMRQNYWTLGAFCAAYCRVVSVHHTIEDQQLFPDLKAADQSLGPILEQLRHEHDQIAQVLDEIDASLVSMVEDEEAFGSTASAVDQLSDSLLAHLRFEEDKLLEPIGRLAIRV